MIKLYGMLRSRATRNYWFLNELGVPFEFVPVMQVYRLQKPDAADAPLNTRSPSFLQINPSAQIPSLVDGSLTLHESLAINLYLARKFGGTMAPATLAEEGLMTQWSLWAATACETNALTVLDHRVRKPPAERDPAIAKAAIDALREPFAALETSLGNASYIVGDRFTVADINVAEVLRYAQAAPELFEATPRVKAWLARCQARPLFKAMMTKREAEPA